MGLNHQNVTRHFHGGRTSSEVSSLLLPTATQSSYSVQIPKGVGDASPGLSATSTKDVKNPKHNLAIPWDSGPPAALCIALCTPNFAEIAGGFRVARTSCKGHLEEQVS